MTTHEGYGHVDSTQPQFSIEHDPQARIEKSMENLSLERASQQDRDLHRKEQRKLESDKGLSQEPIQVPQLDLSSKDENLADPGAEEVIESEQARIERLGRERPAKFKSLGAELAFCYSIIASQFMAVCINDYHCRGMLKPVF